MLPPGSIIGITRWVDEDGGSSAFVNPSRDTRLGWSGALLRRGALGDLVVGTAWWGIVAARCARRFGGGHSVVGHYCGEVRSAIRRWARRGGGQIWRWLSAPSSQRVAARSGGGMPVPSSRYSSPCRWLPSVPWRKRHPRWSPAADLLHGGQMDRCQSVLDSLTVNGGWLAAAMVAPLGVVVGRCAMASVLRRGVVQGPFA
jgi:hypothetical protein